MTQSVGILATGMYVPPPIRRNDFWPADVVARWLARRATAPRPSTDGLGTGAKRVVEAHAQQAADPFQGAVVRHVIPDDMTILDLEERAARDAIERAGIDPGEIDLLLVHEVVSDHQLANPACPLHERLGLTPTCLAMHVEATAYSSLAQLALAEGMIAANRARHALLVQASVATRLIDTTDPSSVLLGDGATAVVLGPVRPGRGFLSSAHFTEGRYPLSLVMSVPGGRWYDEGRPRVHIADPEQLLEAHLRIADTCADAVLAALAKAGHTLADVDYLCVFEGTPWIQRVVSEHLGRPHDARTDIFPRFGYLSSAMIPAALFCARQEGRIADDKLVVITGGGTGMTYGATVLRWGV